MITITTMAMLMMRKNRKETDSIRGSPAVELIHGVKILHNSQFLEEQFILELKTLGILRHVNLLPLLKFCITSKYRLLVYKYMPNGNLYMIGYIRWKVKHMEWIVRLKVAIGSDFSEAIDKSLIGKGFDPEIFLVLKIACNYVDTIPDRRPTMLQVYNDIEAIREERCEQVDEAEVLMLHEIFPATFERNSVEIQLENGL
ncbi:unnamed protein product [Dovyalis caffra]|uniref:Uncharacterized protein n=1 Tax=Dovyalis caffra TaxID=77055 RepID=A0AAV1QY94_9ROSI|nr:unnamed protein product [Dovyalis caffra]